MLRDVVDPDRVGRKHGSPRASRGSRGIDAVDLRRPAVAADVQVSAVRAPLQGHVRPGQERQSTAGWPFVHRIERVTGDGRGAPDESSVRRRQCIGTDTFGRDRARQGPVVEVLHEDASRRGLSRRHRTRCGGRRAGNWPPQLSSGPGGSDLDAAGTSREDGPSAAPVLIPTSTELPSGDRSSGNPSPSRIASLPSVLRR